LVDLTSLTEIKLLSMSQFHDNDVDAIDNDDDDDNNDVNIACS